MTRIRRILFAADFSSASTRALATALALARSSRASLTLAHVITPTPPVPSDPYRASIIWEDVRQEVRAWSEQRLKKLQARVRRSGVRAATLLLEGEPAAELVRAARRQRAELIVLGTHGRTGLRRLLLGSVAQRVVATAACAVVTVRSSS